MIIREYRKCDEQGWLRCRVLSFLNTAYHDNVIQNKETYANPSIELVAEEDEIIVGLIDVELDQGASLVCSDGTRPAGMIWHIAVHPDYQRRGIATKLLTEANNRAKELNVNRFEAWTRDDQWVLEWYYKNGFQEKGFYWHVYTEGKENDLAFDSRIEKFKPVYALCHYKGKNLEDAGIKFNRAHRCVRLDKVLV